MSVVNAATRTAIEERAGFRCESLWTEQTMDTLIELMPFGEFWQVKQNGSVLACAVTRQGAINAVAALLRRQLKDPAAVAALKFVGFELAEVLLAAPMDPNWKRKGLRIEVELFDQAEAFLQTEMVLPVEEALVAEYRAMMADDDFEHALDCLVQLGERQGCSNLFWQVLERLAEAIWPTQWMVDRRAKGQREEKIATIKQRARGLAEPDPTADGGGSRKLSGARSARPGRQRDKDD